MKKLITIVSLGVITLLSGCAVATTKRLNADLKAIESLGITEVVITGKFSHTDYTVTHENGVRRAVVNHTDAWVPQIKVVRETKE